jgi:hypothetical protein
MPNLFDLLDKNIDDLKDLPSFTVPETGIYGLTQTVDVKEINKKPVVEFSYVVRHIVELADSSIEEAARAKAGDKFSIAVFLKDNDGNDSEIGWGRLKEMVQPFQPHFDNEPSLRTMIETHLKEPIDITAKIVKKARKDDKDKYDARISDVTID